MLLTLDDGSAVLAARRLMRAFDIGDATWCDIDTIEDLHSAELLLGVGERAAMGVGTGLTGEARRSAIRRGSQASRVDRASFSPSDV